VVQAAVVPGATVQQAVKVVLAQVPTVQAAALAVVVVVVVV
jgi:hypothetical protein